MSERTGSRQPRRRILGVAFCLGFAATVIRAAPRARTGTVSNGNVRLAATLDLPDGPGPHPVMVVLHASGEGERGFASYRHLPKILPASGIGVLRYDRRGSGASSGDFERASFPDLASDARAVIAWARASADVDRRRLGLWALSQGGWIAPLVAAADPSIACLVIVSGAGGTPAEQMLYSARFALREAGYDSRAIERAVRLRRAVDAYYAGRRPREDVATILKEEKSEPWYKLAAVPDELPRDVRSTKWYYQFAFDPAASMAKVRAPVLLLHAERDPWIPIEQARFAWKARSPAPLTIRTIPGANHFMAATTDPAHDADPEPISEEYTRAMVEWLTNALGIRR
ncbi:MAG TPA: alpha/beta fold hydrolase [Thermoanaerobaculia bacterium]